MIPSVEESVSCTTANRLGRLLYVRALLLVVWPTLIASAAAHTASTRHHASTTADQADNKQHNAHNRENILQIHIHTRRDTYDPSQPFTPWVYGIAHYKFVDYLRRTKTSIKDLPIEDAEEVTAQNDRAQVESSLDLEKLMSGLPPKVRQAIQYVKLDGYLDIRF